MKKYYAFFAVAMLAVLSCAKQEAADDANAPKLNKTELKLMVGDKETLKVENVDKTVAISFKSGDTKIATVNSKTGLVTAKAVGTTVITALAGEAELKCNVTVIEKENVVTSLSISSSDFSLKEGETKQLSATVKPDDAIDKEEALKTLTWSSSDESVATVSNTGLVTAKTVEVGATKSATITAKVISREREITGTVKVTVASGTVLVTGVDLGSEITLNEGGTRQLSPKIVPANATEAEAALKTITYKSSDESVATVSSTGLVTAKSVPEGDTKNATITATVTAKDKTGANAQYTGTVKVNVTSNVVKTSEIRLSKSSLKIVPGGADSFTFDFYPQNHTDSPEAEVSSDDTAVATVKLEGNTVTVSGVADGNAVVTVSVKGAANVKATCAVTVKEGDKAGTCIDMSNTYFEYTWAESLASMSNVTLEAWVNIGSSSSEQSFLGTEGVFLIRAQSGKFQAVTGGGAASGWTQSTETVIGTQATAGEWHHVAATLSADKQIVLYVDGAKAGEGTAKIDAPYPMNGVEGYTDNTNPNIFMVGNGYGRNRFLQGSIAYARVWNVVRSEEQIAADRGKMTPSGNGLIANWYFNEGTGDTIKDYSSTKANLAPKDGSITWKDASNGGTVPSVK